MPSRRCPGPLSAILWRESSATSSREIAMTVTRPSYSTPQSNRGQNCLFVSGIVSCFDLVVISTGKYCLFVSLFVCCRREHKSCEFEMHEAYAIDIIVSTGEGKVRNQHRWVKVYKLSFFFFFFFFAESADGHQDDHFPEDRGGIQAEDEGISR